MLNNLFLRQTVCYIAASATGDSQFCSQFFTLFQEHCFCTIFSGGNCSHQSRWASTNNNDIIYHLYSFLSVVSYDGWRRLGKSFVVICSSFAWSGSYCNRNVLLFLYYCYV